MIPDTLLANLSKSQKEKHQKHVAPQFNQRAKLEASFGTLSSSA